MHVLAPEQGDTLWKRLLRANLLDHANLRCSGNLSVVVIFAVMMGVDLDQLVLGRVEVGDPVPQGQVRRGGLLGLQRDDPVDSADHAQRVRAAGAADGRAWPD